MILSRASAANAQGADVRMVNSAAQAIAATIRDHRVTCDHVIELLVAAGRLAPTTDERTRREWLTVVATLDHFAVMLEAVVADALLRAIEDDTEHIERIRRFYLQPRETYSIPDLAALWQIAVDDVRDVYHDEIAKWENANGLTGKDTKNSLEIKWAKAVHTTAIYGLLRPYDIERALGDDFVNVRTEGWRTVPILIHLPRFVARALDATPAVPRRSATAHRVEQMLFECFTMTVDRRMMT